MRLQRPTHRSYFASMSLFAALTVGQAPAYARHPDLDLDALNDNQLNALIQAELDDDDLVKCGIGNPNARKTKEEMFDVIMCALGDEGDDESEQGLDFDDLEDEMEEAGTTVEAVVRRALDRADAMASSPQSLVALLTAAAHDGAALTSGPARQDDELLAQIADGWINPGRAAVVPVKGGLVQGVRAVRK